MTQKQIPNSELVAKIPDGLREEYDLDSRLPRYESMSPELIQLAADQGIADPAVASHPLFVADFIVTSSEITSGLTDEERRTIMISVYKQMLPSVDNVEAITRLFYLCYQLGQQIRRSNAFLAGRGVQPKVRGMIIMQVYVLPFLLHAGEMIADEGSRSELAVLMAALKFSNPLDEYESLPEGFSITHPEFLKLMLQKMDEYMENHQVQVNDTVVLPYVGDTQLLYLLSSKKLPELGTYNCSKTVTKDSMKAANDLLKFLDTSGQQYRLLYLRGRVHGGDKNVILTKNPEDPALVLMHTPAEEVNVTELLSLITLQELYKDGWSEDLLKPIVESFVETKTVEEEEWRDKTVTEDEEYEEDVPAEPKKKGLFSRIKSVFGGSGDPASKKVKKTRKKSRSVREKVIKKVPKKIKRQKTIGMGLPQELAKSFAILSLSDLRLFEMFDTIRESEYQISGVLYSNFEDNNTTFLATENLGDANELANTLDGIDEVIEQVVSHYFGKQLQILPTELVFVGQADDRLILTLDGDEKKIVGTIAQNYRKDVTEWQHTDKDKIELLKRRLLHMRTGQLLTSLAHTPFDRSVERIVHMVEGSAGVKSIELDHAILKLE